ncbi:hypothetical protein M2163_000524 [Streptomyces sp. SAI-135]|uniref:hypothetical protein n=1 Tax=unclassified Streptomyces TaxID=2593676 RepID=UPI002475517E|nr:MULTISPECIES: hypothetical protein [unclassified Streptomyces]MDH6522971.1 hypothetical protein [Streptomyces sp. SAI-090]MDH6554590.1 hypothetical protein [Streptomyces sp. SAI-041]MDH6573852.1 hypothetical protein [Streptomyces sp. SAI-117]MDH6613416.1 hypothetical protein [Streptomyces sp. SAI-135]
MADTGARKADHSRGLAGVTSLQTAQQQVERVQNNVVEIAARSGIAGDEGWGLSKLFDSWNAEAAKVVEQIKQMSEALQDNVWTAHKLAQHNVQQSEQLTRQTSAGVFQALS